MGPDPTPSAVSFIARFISSAGSSPLSPEALKSSGGEGDIAKLCKDLVQSAGPAAVNLLYKEEFRAQVDEWLSFASAFRKERDPVSLLKRLETYDTYLSTKSVVLGTGTTIGIADVALFVSLHDDVAARSAEELKRYPNLLRWIDYVQNKDNQSRVYAWIPVVKPDFDPPISSTEADLKKGSAALHKVPAKDNVSEATSLPTSSGRQQGLVEERKTPTHLSDSKAATQAEAALVHSKDKRRPDKNQQTGKGDTPDVSKRKETVPNASDALGFEILNIKVGIIKAVKKHPTADALYVEDIDMGEGSLRQVVSGLAKFLSEDEMLNRKVLVLSNVKPSKLRDVLSSGLVLCVSNEDHSQCDPVIPPKEAIVGERVLVAGYEGEPEPVLNPKKKQWEKIYPDLYSDDAGTACYKGKPLTTSAGPCTSSIMKGTIK